MRREYVVVLAAAVLLYAVTGAPGLVWQDSGMIQYRVWHNDIEGGMGLALAHPLFYLIAIGAKYAGVVGFPRSVNMLSAVAGAVTVANIYLLLRLWTKLRLPAVVGAGALALSHTFWRHACIPETYTLYTALFSLELVLLLRYFQTERRGWLYGLALVNGLALANHLFATIPLAVYVVMVVGWWWRKKIRGRDWAVMVLLGLLGSLPYAVLIAKELLATGDWGGTLSSALFGTSWRGDVLNVGVSGAIIKQNVMFVGLNFPTLNLLLVIPGAVALLKGLKGQEATRGFGWALAAITVLFLGFASRYTVVDRYAFFIPFYVGLAVLIGLGLAYWLGQRRRRRWAWVAVLLMLLPIPTYAAAPQLARKAGVSLGMKREVPYRDPYRYFLQPWRWGYCGADRFAAEALTLVEPEAVVYADGTTLYPLLLTQQTEKMREDVLIVGGHGTVKLLDRYGEAAFAELSAERPIYVVSPLEGYCPPFILEQCEFEEDGVLYRAKAK